MIPKKIHYCWFGGKPLSKEVLNYIESWKKYCPDYEIIEWNETNYDVEKNEYTKYCFDNKKWAFLTDYIRLDIIYNEGGIYLDTDVEVLKSFDNLLKNECFIGMEQIGTINTGQGFGATKGNLFVKENKEYYENTPFLNEKGEFLKTICVEITTNILKKYGLKKKNVYQKINNVSVFPTDYFCPKKLGTNKITITENTYSIHHFESSWKSTSRILRKIGYYLIPVKQIIKKIIKSGDINEI